MGWGRSGPAGFASGFSDIFDQMFGDITGSRRGGRSSNRGSDLRYNMVISLKKPSAKNKKRSRSLQRLLAMRALETGQKRVQSRLFADVWGNKAV